MIQYVFSFIILGLLVGRCCDGRGLQAVKIASIRGDSRVGAWSCRHVTPWST